MEIEFDSGLSDISEVDLDEAGPIQPYQYEPRRNGTEQRSDSEEESDFEDDQLQEGDLRGENEIIPDVSTWCVCNNCTNMTRPEEARCCQTTNIVDGKIEAEGLSCIIQHEGFQANCLNIHVLETSYYDYVLQSGPPAENQRIHELYRHIAYRRFTRWIYGLLGKRVRKVIPSCAITAVRNAFPSEQYTGFK